MDVLAHALWTNLAYYKKYKTNLKNRLWAVFFGIAPDLVSFAPSTVYLLFHRDMFLRYKLSLEFGRMEWFFRWAVESYKYTHSFVIFLVCFAIVAFARKGKIYWPMFGWALHIFIDIFTHKDFFQTPFLFPLSQFTNHHAIAWTEPYFMAVNYAVLIILYTLTFVVQRHAKAK